MVAVRLRGGLGNQMFQYAAARALSLHHGTETVLDLSWFEADRTVDGATPRAFGLGPFAIRARTDVIGGWDWAPRGRLHDLRANRRDRRRWGLRGVMQPTPKRLLRLPDDTFLHDGYFQSERYFAQVTEAIRDELRLMAPPDDQGAALVAEIAGSEAVSVHVRRGDYVANAATLGWHGVPSSGYYERALDAVAARTGDGLRLFVFSDDLDWCREHMGRGRHTTFVDANTDRPHEDLRLMSACRHHILANSSFSWWGAWLDPRLDKTVITPQRWVTGWETPDLIPHEWTRLPN